MKTLLTFALLCILTICSGQAKKVDIVDFYYWYSPDGKKYEVMIVSENFVQGGSTPATLRVRYLNGSKYSIVEFYSSIYYDIGTDSNLTVYLMAESEAVYIQGVGIYSPDNFVMKFSPEGKLINGLQADNNELDKDDSEANYSNVEAINYGDANNLRMLIKNFYTSSDSLYKDLMNYAAQYD